MPPARPATSAASAARGARTARSKAPERAFGPRGVNARLPLSRVQWDRKFRTTMLVVLALVGYIGVKGGLTLISVRAQAEQQQQIVRTLARQNRQLLQMQRSLGQPATIIRDARSLGMVRAGERSYAIVGLPGN
jgi:cell division protein FtsB